MPDFPIKITGDASELTKAAAEAKEQLDQASKSVEMLGDMIGLKVPEAIQKMIASSELIGPVLSEAFAPLAAITFGIELFEKLSDKIKEVTNDMAGWDASAQDMYDDLVKNNAELLTFNGNLEIEKLRLNEIGKGGTDKVKQEIDNNSKSTEIWAKQLGEAQKRLDYLTGTHAETRTVPEGDAEYIEQVSNKSAAVGEELKHWDENIKAAQESVTQLTEKIQKAKQVTGPGLTKTLGVDEVKEAISTGEQVLAAKKTLADAELQLSTNTAHAMVEQGKITAAQGEDIDLTSFARERDATIANLRQREQLILSDTTKTAAEKKAIEETTDLQIQTARTKYEDESVRVAGAAAAKIIAVKKNVGAEIRKIAEKAEKDQEEASLRFDREMIAGDEKINAAAIKASKDQFEAWDEAYKGEIEAAKQASEAKIQQITQDFESGKITQQREIAAIAQEKERELEIEKLTQQKRWALWDGDVKKQQEIQNQIDKVIAQSKLVETKAVTDGLKAQEAQYKQVFSQIGSAITGNVMDVLKGTETIAQGFQKMYQSLISSLANYVAQKAEKKAEEWLIDKMFNIKAATSATALASGIAAVSGFASAMKALPFPVNVSTAPGVAAAAGATASGIGTAALGAISASAGGDWQVDTDRLNFVHKNETILPAGIAGKLRNMVESGSSGGVTVVVNHSVNAIDAASFQGTIRTHSNMIANEVTRALKRKGVR